MPYSASFELVDFEIDRPNEESGDEPYLTVVYWALDGNITLGDNGFLRGTPQMIFQGGDHENITRRSLTAADGPVPIPGAVGQASMRLFDFEPELRFMEPIIGMTVVALEEDNTPDGWVNDILADIRTGIPPFAAMFIGQLAIADVSTPAAEAMVVANFEHAMSNEIKSIARKSIARKLGRSLLFGLFALADKDDEIGRTTARVRGSRRRRVNWNDRLSLGPDTVGGGLAGGGQGPNSVPARYLINANMTVTFLGFPDRTIFIDIDFMGVDDDSTDEILDPPSSSFPIEAGRPVSRSFRWGGEMRVEYDFNLNIDDANGNAFLTVNGRLYEGTHELNQDLDARGSLTVAARANTMNSGTLVMENDEWRSDDSATLEVNLRNNV